MVSEMRRIVFAFLIFAAAAAAAAAGDVGLSADRMRTWREDSVQIFMLEGAATLTAEELSLEAENIVAWLDMKKARESGAVTLTVFSETDGRGAVTTVAGERIVIDERSLSASGRPVRSALLRRALEARRQERRRREAAAASPEVSQPSPVERLGEPPGPVTIRYRPVDADGYRLEPVEKPGETLVVIRGGIEILFGDYSMRARNMVIWIPAGAGGRGEETEIKDFQVYAEGDVSFRTPPARLDAGRVFFDYGAERAMLVKAEVHTRLEDAGVPLVMRADEVRVFSDRRFVARDAYVTTCEFGLPHYRLESEEVYLTAAPGAEGAPSALLVARGNRFYLSDMPVLWLPNVARDVKRTQTPLRRFEVGDSNAFGVYTKTEWDLWDILAGGSAESVSARVSKWSDLTALADYYDDRGPAGGLEFEYRREDVAGYALGYYVDDRGTDTSGFHPSDEDRWRLRWRQRAFIDGLQVDTELSDISDRGFLAEYFEREAKEDKEQESYVYAKKTWESAQGSLLYRARLNDFQTQTEYLPEARFDVVRFPLADGRILYASTNRAGNVRFRPDKDLPLPSSRTGRFDTLHEMEVPMRLGSGFNFSPFATARGTWYGDDAAGDEATRYAASWGAKFSFPPLWRVYEVENPTLDVHRLRHIAVLDVTYEDVYDATKTPGELLQFDEVDTVDTRKAATVRLKQRLQTRRPPVEPGEPDRTVDLASLEAEADFFPEPRRDNSGENWSDLRLFARTNLTDDVSLLADGDYDTYSGKFDKAGVWLRTDHSPRTTWGVGSRYLRAASSSTLIARLDHRITELWGIMLFGQYDLDENQAVDETFVLRRKMHRFVLEIAVDYDRGRDDTSVGLRIYPAGMAGTRQFY